MSRLALLAAIAAGLVTAAGALVQVGRWLWRAGAGRQELITAVRDNTSATADLAVELRTLRTEVSGQLADHAHRITQLEQR